MTDQTTDRVTFTINGTDVQAPPGRNLIEACEDAGVYIPRFCHHHRMNPVGMCRMCIVEVDTGRGPSLQPSCMLTVAEGMAVDTESAVTKKAQDGVLEFLLVNHPLDCPVCDKGGECPLQDQTMAYGPGESRFIEEKRHFEKPIPVNDNVFLDRERCILCDRCTRFADEVAGDALIHFIDRGNQTQVNTFPDEPFASYFSGNTVQICPVGALTAKPYRFKARPWDLEEIDSTYPNAMGDRISVQSSRDQVLRVQGVDSDAVNWGWMADKERWAFEALQSDQRLTEPLVRGGGLNEPDPDGPDLVATSWSEALQMAADAIGAVAPTEVAVIGGARLSNEAQYAWTKLAKGVIGTDNVDATMGDELPVHAVLGLPRATIADACRPKGTVLLMGVDPKETHGTLYIRLRHAAREDGARIIELHPTATGLSNVAAARLHARPGESHLVAQALVSGDDVTGDVAGVPAAAIRAAREMIAEGPVTVVVGRGSLAESTAPTLAALAAFRDLDGCRFLPVVHRGNVMGAFDMGMAPGLLPGRTGLDAGRSQFAAAWPTVPDAGGMSTAEALEAAARGDVSVLVLLGADPIADAPQPDVAARALSRATVIAVDLFVTASSAKADIVLPAAAFTEADGSHTNIEGRITAIRQKVTPPGTARPDWMIAAELALTMGADLGIDGPADVWAELAPLSAVHADVSTEAIDSDIDGVLVTATGRVAFEPPSEGIGLTPVDSYALRLVTARRMYDNGTLVQQAPSLAGLAGPGALRLSAYDFNRLGVAEGDAVLVTSGAGSISLPARIDPSVPRGVALADHNRAGTDVRRIVVPDATSVEVRLDAKGSS